MSALIEQVISTFYKDISFTKEPVGPHDIYIVISTHVEMVVLMSRKNIEFAENPYILRFLVLMDKKLIV